MWNIWFVLQNIVEERLGQWLKKALSNILSVPTFLSGHWCKWQFWPSLTLPIALWHPFHSLNTKEWGGYLGYQILEFHVERTQGAHVPRGVSGWADSEGRGIWGVSCMIGLPEKNMLWMDFKSSSKYNASVSDCFLENQRNSASPRVLWRLCGLQQWS